MYLDRSGYKHQYDVVLSKKYQLGIDQYYQSMDAFRCFRQIVMHGNCYHGFAQNGDVSAMLAEYSVSHGYQWDTISSQCMLVGYNMLQSTAHGFVK